MTLNSGRFPTFLRIPRTSSGAADPSYLFGWLVEPVGVHGQYGVPGAHEEHAGGAVQEEGAEVGHALELTWTDQI